MTGGLLFVHILQQNQTRENNYKDVRPVEGDQGKGLSLSLSLEHEATRGTGGLMEHSNSCLGS